MSGTNKELADAINAPLDMSQRVPCEHPMMVDATRTQNCIDLQLQAARGKSKGWHGADPNKMCASCACYWHLSCARNFALGVVR